MPVQNGLTNCCFDGADYWNHIFMGPGDNNAPGACCETGNARNYDDIGRVCMPNNVTKIKLLATSTQGNKKIVCIGAEGITDGDYDENYPDFPTSIQVRCNGTFIVIDGNKYTEPYRTITPGTGGTQYTPQMVYYTAPVDGQTVHDPDTMHDATPGTESSWYIRY